MNLLELRTEFIRISGRYDLVVDNIDFADNGADFYINAGQKYLDRLENIKKSWGRVFRQVTAGRNYVVFPDCRAIESAWIMNTESRTKLEKVDMSDLREEYGEPVSAITTGVPLYYSPAYLRVVPESDRMTIDEFEAIIDYADVMFDQHYNYNGVIFMPPVDGDYVCEVWGLFYSPTLTNDTDESFWSVVHPSILIMAGQRELEAMNRNSEGVKDWEGVIRSEITTIGMDAVEETVAELDDMEG